MTREKVRRLKKRERPLVVGRILARHFVVYPDLANRARVIHLHIARNVHHMRETCLRQGHQDHGTKCEGMVCSPSDLRGRNGKSRTWSGNVVARMFLNARSLVRRPSEIVAHECAHAGMAWARLRRVDPTRSMANEEVLAYAVGELVLQVNRACFAAGVFE